MNHTEAEYRMHWDLLRGNLLMIEAIPLDEMLASVRLAESVGPLIDPTAYRDGAKNLPPQREILEANESALRSVLAA